MQLISLVLGVLTFLILVLLFLYIIQFLNILALFGNRIQLEFLTEHVGALKNKDIDEAYRIINHMKDFCRLHCDAVVEALDIFGRSYPNDKKRRTKDIYLQVLGDLNRALDDKKGPKC